MLYIASVQSSVNRVSISRDFPFLSKYKPFGSEYCDNGSEVAVAVKTEVSLPCVGVGCFFHFLICSFYL